MATPKTSTPKSIGAIKVFVALPNTATYPIAPHTIGEIPNQLPSTTPSVAPIENKGVTSPPWKPIAKVTIVSSSFTIKS